MKKLILALLLVASVVPAQAQRPNVIFICADDLGYGDLGSYGATKLKTPNIDKLAAQGIRFTNGHCTSATCTPSRYAMMTGQYPWRKDARILPGDAALIVPTDKTTLPKVFRQAGYATGIVGKWHLGLGSQTEKNWNADVTPGPNETGFDYSFIFPATADRVPTVFMENHRVLGLDPNDPIKVNYQQKVGNDPTGAEHPELLKMQASPNHGHNQTIVNGIGRIGYMSGGTKARWVDEELSFTFVSKAQEFIRDHAKAPFFLYFASTEPHVPRMPAAMFRGKSGLGYRGDAILQLDWTVGEIVKALEQAGIAKNTLILFSSDNGPVLDDGYQDGAVTELNGHTPAGPLRGGKYSAFEGGTRVPFILSWPGGVKAGVSDALVCQLDFLASFARMLGVKLPAGETFDSEDQLDALLGRNKKDRSVLVQQGGALSIVSGDWKYIEPAKGPAVQQLTGTETGNSDNGLLYQLKTDIGERKDVSAQYPQKVAALKALLDQIKAK